jgi:transcriptional regulator with XRE-family HTH domain
LKENLQFSRRLEKLMDNRKIGPSDLAKEVDVTHVAVGDWLKGTVPKTESFRNLSKFFGVTMEWLLDGETTYPEHGQILRGDFTRGTPHWAPIISEVAAGTIGREFLDAEHAALRMHAIHHVIRPLKGKLF